MPSLLITKIKEWSWTIFCLYLMACAGLLLLSFLAEAIRWGNQIVWTLSQHYFWDYLLMNWIALTVCYAVIVVGFTALNTTKKYNHYRK